MNDDSANDNIPTGGVHIAKLKSAFKLQAALLGADKPAAVATDAHLASAFSSSFSFQNQLIY